MDKQAVRSFRNQLLDALPPETLAELGRELEPVSLPVGTVLEKANDPISHAYFLESGVASVVALVKGGKQMEAGPFGRDGMSGLAALHHVASTPLKTIMQIEGSGHRVPMASLMALVETSPAARKVLLRYAYAFSLQAVYTAVAAGVGLLEHRLARWLLMLHDRIDGDEMLLTHDFMAMMLSVRRPGVTVALHVLEGRALIRSMRGRVLIRDRDGLIELCGELYGAPEAAYRQLIPGR